MVVTIVVLLILAGVSISLILDNNGIIQKSKDAKREYGQARTNEQADLDNASDWIDEQVTGSLKVTEETKPYLPNGNYTKVQGTNLDSGLVIRDGNGNEYVWVEVPRTTTVYGTAGLNITEFSAEELTSIKTDLVNYATDYRKSGWDDTYYSGCGIADSDTYTDMYNKMLKSVYQNGGFWIGRYEIGDSEATSSSTGRIYSSKIEHTPVIKANQIPYTYITCSQAENLAETFAPTGYTTSLMFGLQWDLVCKYLETKGTNPGTTADSIQNAIKSNSTDWGNYSNASFDVTNINAMYSESYGSSWKKVSEETDKKYSKASGEYVLLTTGAEARNSMLNICDLAGNVWEWTLEKTSYDSNPCAGRGGIFFIAGSSNPATNRENNTTTKSDNFYGARVSLY